MTNDSTIDIERAITNEIEIRVLVDNYYRWQEERKRSAHQVRTVSAGEVFLEIEKVFRDLEKKVEKKIKEWAKTDHMAVWAMQHRGIGHTLAAGLAAHIDITKAPCVSSIYRFAGIDGPSVDEEGNPKWGKGKKRPHNADLKKLCYLIGDSFVKNSNAPDCLYGHHYRARKDFEIQHNERGDYADQAADALRRKKFDKKTAAYKHYSGGKLSPAHIDARARRWAVKQFLLDWFNEAYRHHYKKEPPEPYAVAHLKHVHPPQPAMASA